ncbi:alpha/beta hydrolase family protein [Pseudoalteromonas mariniglutinosa]|uniref:alpha/beta hydrolase family protein n=1 Tax=Pseudoalteromonas mariniglutinosa TaxID=206042 RepID=UPI00384E7E39
MNFNVKQHASNRFRELIMLLSMTVFSHNAIAEPLDKSAIQFVGPIAADMQLKPYQTEHNDAIINNLLPSLRHSAKSINVFSETIHWQSFNNVNALTLGGLQALKFTASASRFSQGTLTLKGIDKAQLFINGEKQQSQQHSYELALSQGDHQIIIIAEQVANWHNVEIDYQAKTNNDRLTIHYNQTHGLSAKQLYDSPTITALSLSPDATQYITTTRYYQESSGNQARTVTELKNSNNQVVYRFESGQPSNITWSPDNNTLVYILDGQLKQLHRKTLALNVIAENIQEADDFHYYDNNSLLFVWSKSPPADDNLTKHYRGLQDRWSYARTTSQVYLMDIASGLSKPLSQGPQSHVIEDFNSKRGTVLLSRAQHTMQASVQPITELLEINITNAQTKLLGQYTTFNQAKYTGDDIYIIAGPDFHDGIGRNLPTNMLANNYDGQLYLLTKQGTNILPLSKQFDPAIAQLSVLANGDALIKVTEQDTIALYQFDLSKQRFIKLTTGLDVIEQFSHSKERNPSIIFSGTTASTPQQLKRLKINKDKATIMWDSSPISYANTDVAKLEEFNFTNNEGVEIQGRVYLPRNLDTTKKYPALVYYYGGTSPVTRGFTGRYPFNLWAEHGYVVYVLQPTGATGFGQEFSAKHVNAWGQFTANDIIQGTHALLDTYHFIDRKRIGNLGASYGGFMTMLLATKTDMFSASIAHAGISNITSYWGQGWWGYLYSGEASKNSFPWNNNQLYSQHSPVFHAEKVTTPLLLLHGDADTNVPVGESHTMYTALKLLGKDVELIEYKGANHQILARDKRFDWWDTMLAYFDKHLKDQPQWWQYLYPDK